MLSCSRETPGKPAPQIRLWSNVEARSFWHLAEWTASIRRTLWQILLMANRWHRLLQIFDAIGQLYWWTALLVEIEKYDVGICSPWRCGQIRIEFLVARLPRLKSFINLVLSAARRGGPWFSLWDVFLNVCAVNTSPIIILQLHVLNLLYIN